MQLNRGTLILLGICILVIVGVFVLQEPLQAIITSPINTAMVQTILPPDIAQQAIQLTVRNNDDFTEIKRIDDIWQVTDGTAIDTKRETHHELVDGMLQLMAGFQYSSTFESDDLAQFDLENVTTSIEIFTQTEKTYTLKLGTTNPDGDQIYMMLDDEPTIYLMPTVFEFANIIRLAVRPPYHPVVAEATEEVSSNLLFPDIFGYQVTEFMIRDERDGSFIRYTQGELGTWIVDGTIVDDTREIDHVQAAVNVSKFLFLEIDPSQLEVADFVTNLSILTLSMKTEDSQSYTISILDVEGTGFTGILTDGSASKAYQLDAETVNLFFEMVRQPPYAT